MPLPANLPLRLHTNVGNQVYSGPATLAFEFDLYTEEKAKPFFFSATIWSRAANAQFFTSGTGLTRIDLLSINQSATTLSLNLQLANAEPALWVPLLCQLAQVAQQTGALRLTTLVLDDWPVQNADWFEAASRALFAPVFMPQAFAGMRDFLLPGKPLHVEIEFARKLSEQEFAMLEKELELWGCLLATGGLRLDFSPVTESLHALSFGTSSQLTASWIRYVKQAFEGPVSSVALFDHFLAGLQKRGIPVSGIEFS